MGRERKGGRKSRETSSRQGGKKMNLSLKGPSSSPRKKKRKSVGVLFRGLRGGQSTTFEVRDGRGEPPALVRTAAFIRVWRFFKPGGEKRRRSPYERQGRGKRSRPSSLEKFADRRDVRKMSSPIKRKKRKTLVYIGSEGGGKKKK